ncbi:MAG TPA: alpha/beta hydrolase, partial [Chryseolinea sp.]|nr:alpha/beta hydrolase [Chryseolinea sp.]
MLSMDWEFFKNSVKIANPFKGDEPFFMTSKVFQEAFANTLTTAAAKEAFERFVVHDSRNVLRDCLRAPGQVDLDIPHAPLLFIAGEKDRFIPDKLVAKNARAYKNENSTAEYKEFHHRSHYICNEPGWEEVAQFVAEWIDRKWEGSSEPVGRMSEGY